MDNIIVERVHEDIYADINTCNHPRDPSDMGVADLDYQTEIKKTTLENYIDLVNYPVSWRYTFEDDEINILIKFDDENKKNNQNLSEDIVPIIIRLQNNWIKGSWFFRFNSTSPKDGSPSYPVFSASDTISKIITSKRAFNCISENEKTIYFVKYDTDWDIKGSFEYLYTNKTLQQFPNRT